MQSRSEYLAIWLGVTSLGIIVSLINTNLRGPRSPTASTRSRPKTYHCGRMRSIDFRARRTHLPAGPKSGSTAMTGRAFRPHRQGQWPSYSYGRPPDEPEETPTSPSQDRALLHLHLRHHDRPAQGRLCQPSPGDEVDPLVRRHDGRGPSDRLYNCLPMYHSVGGVVATGARAGRRRRGHRPREILRAPASGTMSPTAAHAVPVYRRAVPLSAATPAAPARARAPLAAGCGNGLSRRGLGGVPAALRASRRILEFYAATEGNFSLYNAEGKPGAIGRIPPFLAHRFPAALVRFDVERGRAGARRPTACASLCAAARPAKPSARSPPARARRRFEGYTDAAATEKKILRDVFEPGDAWFRTGDLMRQDAQGFFYFVDRIGDTFRWKGENVATTEVAEALARVPRRRPRPMSMASRCPARMGAPAWPRSSPTALGFCRAARPPRGGCRIMPAAVPADPTSDRRDRHFQAR